jgi:diguanylate cyclase (GGDEF)-like protein
MNQNDEITIEFIENNLNIIKSLYDSMRIVDPKNKKVLLYNKGAFTEGNNTCFDDIGRDEVCVNCISMRSLNNKDTFIKIENINEKIYLITAMPLEFKGRTVIVELIKDVTNNLFYGNSITGENKIVNNIIEDMKSLAIKDGLTGIYNRRFIDERLPVDINQCKLNGEPISIIMIDIDYFKNFNDKFGHITGDFVLKEFVNRLQKFVINKKDWIARYGGEEFLICIPGSIKETAVNLAKQMREHMIKKSINYNNQEFNITASFGICTMNDKNMTFEELIKCADEKLYEAKNSGRNRIVS